MQALFYASAVIYPISIVLDQSTQIAKLILMNPVSQAIQDTRHVLINSNNPTLYTITDNWLWYLIPLAIVAVTAVFGIWIFKKRSPYFAENI